MLRFFLQIVALLAVAVAGGVLFWRIGTSNSTPSSASSSLLVATRTPTTAGSHLAAAGSSADAQPVVSWPGKPALYLGRYELRSSSDTSVAQNGGLTIFMRVVPHEPRPVLSGVLTLISATDTTALYLTHFMHAGTKLWTSVNLGIFTGPQLGQLDVTVHGQQLTAELVQKGQTPITLSFRRISSNPHP